MASRTASTTMRLTALDTRAVARLTMMAAYAHRRAAQARRQQDRQHQPGQPPLPSGETQITHSSHGTYPLWVNICRRGSGRYSCQELTMALKVLPRSMKFLNWSKAAQAGERVTTSPGTARSRAVSTARWNGVTSSISGWPGPVTGGLLHGGPDFICRGAAQDQQLHVLHHLGTQHIEGNVLVIAPGDEDYLLLEGAQARDGAGRDWRRWNHCKTGRRARCAPARCGAPRR